nr:protein takeout [Helicoverpa armigera]
MKGGFVIVCVAVWLAECSGSFITPCREEDLPCLKASAQEAVPILAAGIPSMGIATLDPMHVDRVKTMQAGLLMDFRNTSVTGLKHCKVLMLKRHGPLTNLDLKCSVTMVGDYTLGGKLLIMPINGDGRYTIKIRDIVVKIQFHIGQKTRDGDQYWVVESWKHTSEVEKGVHFRFKNLFNGNQELSDAVHNFANSNWRDIFHEVAPPIVKAIVSKIVSESTKLFDKVPIKELVIE